MKIGLSYFLLSLSFVVFSACKPSALSDEQSASSEFRYDVYAHGGCMLLGSRSLNAVTIAAGSNYRIQTVRLQSKQTLRTAFVQIEGVFEKRHENVVAVINAGFFNESTGAPVSAYRSEDSTEPGVVMGSRPCLVIEERNLNGLSIESYPSSFFAAHKDVQNLQYQCAGPELLRDGKDVVRESLLRGQFIPLARNDRGDPLSYEGLEPRSALCVHEDKSVTLFAALGRLGCGFSLVELPDILKAHKCVTAIALDGGASVAMAYKDLDGVHYLDNLTSRSVPVWLVVTKAP